MTKNLKWLWIFLLTICTQLGFAQDSTVVSNGEGSAAMPEDSAVVFTYDEFITIVKADHPVAFQAGLMTEQGDLYLQKARGGFDPKLYGTANQKYYEGKQYYSYLNGGLKIPTWFGLSVDGGYSLNDGTRLNPESLTPDAGLWNLGLSANLGKGLFIDQRRADIKQAEIYARSTLLEQRLMVNQLMYDATLAYYDWFAAYNQRNVYADAVINAEERLENTRQSCFLGDKACVDTLKALIQLQDRQLKLEQGNLKLQNKRVLLETFLWQDGFIPLEMTPTLVPPDYDALNTIIDASEIRIIDVEQLANNHPEVLIQNNKIEIAKIDYRLRLEDLKPTVELKYNALGSPVDDGFAANYSVEDYNWGAKVSYPIFTFKERANLRLTRIQLEQQEAELANKSAAVRYKINAARNTWFSLNEQITIYSKAVVNYDALLDAEVTLFQIGESSMFLINTRDQNLIEAQIKLIDIILESRSAKAFYNYQTFGFE